VVEIPLLFENDLHSHFVQTISTFATRELQFERLLERGLPKEQANARIGAQMPCGRKAELADVVFLGCGSLGFLERQVVSFLNSNILN
jgi:dephospho-CoA kinase